MIRVLHSVAAYLKLSENWIYPQVTRVSGADGRVFCDFTVSPEAFPLSKERLIAGSPPWGYFFGIPRLVSALSRRVGCGGYVARARIRAWRPHILHAHFGMRGFESLDFKRRLNLSMPLVTSFYGCDAWLVPQADPAWRNRFRKLFDLGERFLVEGPAMRDRLGALGCPVEKIMIQRIGVDLAAHSFHEKDFSDGLKIIMIARFVEKKGLVDGLRACALARRRGVKLRVTLVGDATPNDAAGESIKRTLREIAGTPELAGHVQFTGFVPLHTAIELMKDHNVFLCPSKRAGDGDAEGGSPVILTQAMAVGLACIGTRHCDIPEVILNRKTGFLCQEGNIGELADAIEAAGSQSAHLVEVCRAGRKHVEDNFSVEGQLDGLRRLYESLVNTKAQA